MLKERKKHNNRTMALEGKLSVTVQINCSAARCLINVIVPLSGRDDVALFNGAANDSESTQKPIITSYSLV